MAKLYYGDENNTAVEINVGGDVSDCIKKDGTTTTTARIPFAKGIGIDSDNYWTENDFVSFTSGDTGGYTQIQNSNGNVAALYSTNPDGSEINNGVKVEPDGLQIMTNGETGTSGQVLTAQGDGTCEWADMGKGFTHVGNTANFRWYKDSNNVKMCVVDQTISVPLTEGSGELKVEGPPVGCEPINKALNIGASFSCADGYFTLVNVYVAKAFTNIRIYDSHGNNSPGNLYKGTVFFYQ